MRLIVCGAAAAKVFTLPLVVFNGIVGFATVSVLIPPVNVLRIGFKEFDKFLFRIRRSFELNERYKSMILCRKF